MMMRPRPSRIKIERGCTCGYRRSTGAVRHLVEKDREETCACESTSTPLSPRGKHTHTHTHTHTRACTHWQSGSPFVGAVPSPTARGVCSSETFSPNQPRGYERGLRAPVYQRVQPLRTAAARASPQHVQPPSGKTLMTSRVTSRSYVPTPLPKPPARSAHRVNYPSRAAKEPGWAAQQQRAGRSGWPLLRMSCVTRPRAVGPQTLPWPMRADVDEEERESPRRSLWPWWAGCWLRGDRSLGRGRGRSDAWKTRRAFRQRRAGPFACVDAVQHEEYGVNTGSCRC